MRWPLLLPLLLDKTLPDAGIPSVQPPVYVVCHSAVAGRGEGVKTKRRTPLVEAVAVDTNTVYVVFAADSAGAALSFSCLLRVPFIRIYPRPSCAQCTRVTVKERKREREDEEKGRKRVVHVSVGH